jgi:SAM-dependent methyltransferase
LNEETIGTDAYWWIALQNAAFYADMKPLIEKYVRGRTLDIGAGQLAWRPLLKKRGTAYISGDLTREHPEIDTLFDATKAYPFANGSFDTLFCCSVLEHAREPWLAFDEMWRVLAPGGVAIVSVPFVFYLHGQPHDYYRFTRYAIKYLAERAGFEIEEMVVNGGLVQMLLNIPSVMLSTILSAVGLTRLIPTVTRVFLALDRLVGARLERQGLFAMNHIAVLKK